MSVIRDYFNKYLEENTKYSEYPVVTVCQGFWQVIIRILILCLCVFVIVDDDMYYKS